MPQRQSPDQTSKPASHQSRQAEEQNPRMGDPWKKLSQEFASLRGDTPTKGCRSAHPRRPPPPRPLPGAPKEPDACGCVRCTAEYTAVPARLAPYPQHHQIQPATGLAGDRRPVLDWRAALLGAGAWKGWPRAPRGRQPCAVCDDMCRRGKIACRCGCRLGRAYAIMLHCYPPVCSARA
jgi:hypothetical protein